MWVRLTQVKRGFNSALDPRPPFLLKWACSCKPMTIAICHNLETTTLKCSLVSDPDFLTPLQVSLCLYFVTEAGKLLDHLEATWQTMVEMAGVAIV